MAFSPADQLIALCIHGARHNWREPKHVCDVAAFIDLQKEMDWKRLMSYASDLHNERIVLLGLLLAEKSSGVQLPEEVSDQKEKNSALQALASQLQHYLDINSEGSSRLIEEMNFWFRARERLQDRVHCIIRLAVEPTQIDGIFMRALPVLGPRLIAMRCLSSTLSGICLLQSGQISGLCRISGL